MSTPQTNEWNESLDAPQSGVFAIPGNEPLLEEEPEPVDDEPDGGSNPNPPNEM